MTNTTTPKKPPTVSALLRKIERLEAHNAALGEKVPATPGDIAWRAAAG